MDTSTPAVTVAVYDGERVLAEATTVDPRRHTELLMPQVTRVLREAGAGRRDVTAVAVGVGPGPFTGLRVGLAAARAWGAALDVPVHGVCSLDVVAYGARAAQRLDEPFLVATDARRREVYWAAYNASGVRIAGPDVGPATAIELPGELPPAGRLVAAGAGARLYSEAFVGTVEPEYPSAGQLAAAVVEKAVEIVPPDPLYLRRPDATPPSARKKVLA